MWIFEKLLEDFRDVCEQGSVLIISGSTEYEFSAATFMSYQSYQSLLLSWDACVQRQTRDGKRLVAYGFHS